MNNTRRINDKNRTTGYFALRYTRFTVLYAKIEISQNGFLVRSTRVMRKDMLPIPLMNVPYRKMAVALQKWLEDRMIPASRNDVANAVRVFSGISDKDDYMPYMRLMGLFSYCRCMTDKYWMTPVNEKLTVKFGQHEYTMLGKPNYKHMDFHKKDGVAYNFGNLLLSENIEPNTSVGLDFQTPDFCTTGNMKKRWRCDQFGFWLEKYFDGLSEDEINALAQKIIDARQDDKKRELQTVEELLNIGENASYSDDLCMMPAFDFLYDDKEMNIIGYKTRILTSEFIDLVTLKDMCQYGHPEKRSNFSINDLSRAITDFSIDKNVIQHKIDIAKQYLGDGDCLFENAGFLVSIAPGREIQKFVMWI